ncbi:MAG: radical SAM family heme chaperone HemW [Chloroflexota bacterium]|nr:radical SAM family heme chaperone HemW [Chloroflexota bacterium]MBI5702545.1 radical SAM family heme chaperone HemW [Chloroflexota bacterium]
MEHSLYIHIPFCTHRCAYCDFNTYAGQETLMPAYVNALIREIQFIQQRLDQETSRLSDHPTIKTVFFGGGTPSLLSPPQFEAILSSIRSAFALTPNAEITIEANPGTVTYEDLRRLREIGINRISFGVQSANPFELRMLERAHTFFDVIQAVTSARKAGFDNLNLDLIYGLPEQTLASWQTTVRRILDLHPEHISAYALTLEHGTPFGRWASKGLLPLPDPDLAAEMYEWASEALEANGYVQYEISNWAKDDRRPQTVDDNPSSIVHRPPSTVYPPPSFACKHNLQYWRSLPYLGLGAGAHGYAGGYRYSNVLRIKTYIERLTNYQSTNYPFPFSPAAVNRHRQTLEDDMSEYMLNNLRLVKAGVAESDFRSRFGRGLLEVYGREVEELLQSGLLEYQEGTYRLTRRGRLLGNRVFVRFV